MGNKESFVTRFVRNLFFLSAFFLLGCNPTNTKNNSDLALRSKEASIQLNKFDQAKVFCIQIKAPEVSSGVGYKKIDVKSLINNATRAHIAPLNYPQISDCPFELETRVRELTVKSALIASEIRAVVQAKVLNKGEVIWEAQEVVEVKSGSLPLSPISIGIGIYNAVENTSDENIINALYLVTRRLFAKLPERPLELVSEDAKFQNIGDGKSSAEISKDKLFLVEKETRNLGQNKLPKKNTSSNNQEGVSGHFLLQNVTDTKSFSEKKVLQTKAPNDGLGGGGLVQKKEGDKFNKSRTESVPKVGLVSESNTDFLKKSVSKPEHRNIKSSEKRSDKVDNNMRLSNGEDLRVKQDTDYSVKLIDKPLGSFSEARQLLFNGNSSDGLLMMKNLIESSAKPGILLYQQGLLFELANKYDDAANSLANSALELASENNKSHCLRSLSRLQRLNQSIGDNRYRDLIISSLSKSQSILRKLSSKI